MSFDLATVATQLETRLEAAVTGVTVRNVDAAAPTNLLAPLLTYEQGNVATEFEGTRLAVGHVAVEFTLVLAAPETDPVKGTQTVFEHLPALCRALDAVDDIQWSRADKGRDASGTFYSIPVVLFATYPEPIPEPVPEPDPAPDEDAPTEE